jgi:hypothetical protein
MKTGFHDPIAPKVKEKKEKSPWDFRCPSYDERTSCYMNAGRHYGIGHRQPVGHDGNPKMRTPVLPYGRPATMQVSHAPPISLQQDMIE